MRDDGSPTLYGLDCSDCGRPTVTSSLCARPDLCYSCFTARVTANREIAGELREARQEEGQQR